MTRYIQRKQGREVETVDEFPVDTKAERAYLREMLREYQMSDPSASYYISRRPCKGWND